MRSMDTGNMKYKQICCGYGHCLLININDNIESFGDNSNGQIGSHNLDLHHQNEPKLISFLINYKFKKISCGANHSLCLDVNGKIFAFGANEYYQCAQKHKKNNTDIREPQRMQSNKKKIKFVDIKSGRNHNFCKSELNEYYVCGNNDYNQCLMDTKGKCIKTLTKIIISDIANNLQILNVFPGFNETRLVVKRKEPVL